MTFDVKPGDVVVVQSANLGEYSAWVQRLTKTQIITRGFSDDNIDRYSRDDGVDLSKPYSRWDRRNCIVRLATPEQAQQHIAKVMAERARIKKCEELAALFAGMPVSSGPYQDKGGWQISFTIEHLTEPQLRGLAERLRSAWPPKGAK